MEQNIQHAITKEQYEHMDIIHQLVADQLVKNGKLQIIEEAKA